MDKIGTITGEPTWKDLYRAGGAAPLIAIVLSLTQIIIIAFGEPYPITPEDWFSLFQRSRLLGLIYMNALDIASIAIIGVMFLALYVALRRYHESYMAVAAFFAFLGVALFVTTRSIMLSVLPLSEQYAAAATGAEREQILAAGQMLNSLGVATPQTMGFFFMAAAVLIISVVMLRSDIFGRWTAYVGILTSVITFIDDISTIIAPSAAVVLMPVSGLFWIIWWILIARRLFQLGRLEKEGLPQQS